MRNRLMGWLAAALCLALVGVLRAGIPNFLNDQLPVRPTDGAVATRDFSARLVDITLARSLRSPLQYAEETLTTEQTFVVARIKVTAHRNTMVLIAELHTPDGLTYTALRHRRFPTASVVYVGQANTESFIFEVPSEKVAGSWVSIRPRPGDGLQPVQEVARFDVGPADDIATDFTVPEAVLEPAS